MAAFVLIHGSGQNARCWAELSRRLEADGHVVAAPELPKQAPEWTLLDFAGEIARSIASPDTVVVAHSFSGVFLPAVARARDCAALVFLAAVIPEEGKSVRQQYAEDPGMFAREWILAGPRWFDPAERESLAREFLFHDCDPGALPAAVRTLDLFDTRHLVTEPAPFPAPSGVPVASIVATGDRTLTADWGRRMTRRVLGCEPIEIEAGHCPHTSRPDELARMLETIADGPIYRGTGARA
jgi:pimeloyl-ACP methyl ester carboxylesterase